LPSHKDTFCQNFDIRYRRDREREVNIHVCFETKEAKVGENRSLRGPQNPKRKLAPVDVWERMIVV
jgi:hypothetical protein